MADDKTYDYDESEITPRERKASENQTLISQQDVLDVRKQLERQLSNYDFADEQNRSLANAQRRQNALKSEADRFEAQRDLQSAALGLLGSMGTALNGSSAGNLTSMLNNRQDKENSTYWAQLQQNQDAVENSYNDSLNQNLVARRDAMQSAEKAVRDIEGEWQANMNNINPQLFPGIHRAVGNDSANFGSGLMWRPNEAQMNTASQMSGYRPAARSLFPQPSGNAASTSSDYFSQLMNRFNAPETHRTPERLQNFAGLGIEEEQRMRDELESMERAPGIRPSQVPVQTPYKTGDVTSLRPSQVPQQSTTNPSSASQASQTPRATTNRNGLYYTDKNTTNENYYQRLMKGL